MTDPILQVAFWTGVGALVLTCAIGLQTVGLRMALLRRQRRERAFLARWRPVLMAYLVDTASPLPTRLARGDRLFFLKLWNHLQESLRGDASASLNAAAYRLGCDALARDMLRRGNRARRLLAILTLGHLRDGRAWDMLAVQAEEADSAVSVNALRALVQIDAGRVAAEFTPHLLTRAEWPLARLAAILLEHQAAFAPALTAALPGAAPREQARALRLLEALHYAVPDAVLAPLFAPGAPPERLVGALRLTPTPGLLAQARKLAGHPDWRVRVQVAKVLGAAGDRADTLQLRTLLADREWWVRYRAAHALAVMPSFGLGEFAALAERTDDRYARDMLTHVLAEGSRA